MHQLPSPLPRPRAAAWLVAIACSAGVALEGCDSTVGISPRQDDRTPPVVESTDPPDGALGVPIPPRIEVTFSEPMDAATVHPGTFRVRILGDPKAGAVVVGGERTFYFVPVDPLPENRRVEVELSGVLDRAGNPLASYRFTFSTEGSNPLPPPQPSNPDPGDGGGEVPIDVTLGWEGGGGGGNPGTYDVWVAAGGDTIRPPSELVTPSFRPGPLAYATDYAWQVTAHSPGGSTPGPVWTFTTEQNPDPGNRPPPVPCSPAPGDGQTGVATTTTLGWDCLEDPDGDAVTFEVYLGTSADPPLVGVVDAPPFAPPSPLAEGAFYRWRVVADDGRGGRTSSPIWEFHTVMPNGPPSAPAPPITPPHMSTTGSVVVELTWSGGDDPDGDPVAFDVRLGTTPSPPLVATVSEKRYQTGALDNGARYYWKIVARDDHGHDVEGPRWWFRTPDTPNRPPSAPSSPVPASGARDVAVDATLRWSGGDDPDGDVVQFVVYLEQGDPADPDSVATVSVKSYAPELEYETSYSWRIEARDGRGGVASSPVWSFDTEEFNPPPVAPCNPSPGDGEQNVAPIDVTLTWGCGHDPEGESVLYEVHFGNTPDPPLIDTTNERRYHVGGLDLSTLYYWQIVARDERDASTPGPVWSFRTFGPGGEKP